MGVEIHGEDELNKKLDEMIDKANELQGTSNVTGEELFTNKFMQENTKFSSIDEFENESKFDFSNFDNIDQEELDSFVAENTSFDSWEEMLGTASQEYAVKQLGF